MDFSQGRRVIGDPGFQSLKILGNTEGTFFCSFCGEKFHQREKFKQHKEQELAKLPASSEAVLHQPSIMPAPSRSQLSPTDFRSSTVTAPPSTTSSAQCNIVGPQDQPLAAQSERIIKKNAISAASAAAYSASAAAKFAELARDSSVKAHAGSVLRLPLLLSLRLPRISPQKQPH